MTSPIPGEEPDAPHAPIDWLVRPFHTFAARKLAGSAVLLAATVLALICANSGLKDRYLGLLHTTVTLGLGDFVLSKPALHWINDGLMSFFFFVLGLEIKRELIAGELADRRRALLPISAAVGGMVVPAGLYALLNLGGEASHGWGVPMATDVAFALGVLAVLGSRVPVSLKIFLTALAIVDDIGAILVIALFYTDHLAVGGLVAAGLLVGFSAVLNRLGVRNTLIYFLIGTACWLALLKSGVHATLAAVVMAFTIPARTRLDGAQFKARMIRSLDAFERGGLPAKGRLLDHDEQHLLDQMTKTLDHANAPLQHLEHTILPLVTFAVLPLFALANAGVVLDPGSARALTDPLSLGILAGLCVGKPLGIFGFSWLAVRLGLARLPTGVDWSRLTGVAILAGIGFTMSIFIGGLAFVDPSRQSQAKLAVLVASTLSAIAGSVWLLRMPPPEQAPGTARPR